MPRCPCASACRSARSARPASAACAAWPATGACCSSSAPDALARRRAALSPRGDGHLAAGLLEVRRGVAAEAIPAARHVDRAAGAVDAAERPLLPPGVPGREAEALAVVAPGLGEHVLLMGDADVGHLPERRLGLAPAPRRVFHGHRGGTRLPLDEELEAQLRVARLQRFGDRV